MAKIGSEAPVGANVKLGAKAWGAEGQKAVNLFDGDAVFDGQGTAEIELKSPLVLGHRLRLVDVFHGTEEYAMVVNVDTEHPADATFGDWESGLYAHLYDNSIYMQIDGVKVGGTAHIIIDDLGEWTADCFSGTVALTETSMQGTPVMMGTFETVGFNQEKAVYVYLNGTCIGAAYDAGAETEIDGYPYFIGVAEEGTNSWSAGTLNMNVTSMNIRIAQER